MSLKQSTTVLVFRGGPSRERAISLVSGAAVASACRRLGYNVIEADIGPDDLGALEYDGVVFPVLHGQFGEDGQLQAILEQRRMRFVGSGAVASRLAMDKGAAKRAWCEVGLSTAPWTTVDFLGGVDDLPISLAPPVVVKPLAEGSSIGVRMCATADTLREAVADITRIHGRVLIEKRLVGPELTVGILGNDVLPIIQVKPAHGFYDYQAKYERDDTAYLLEPEIDRDTYRLVHDLAWKAFQSLGCRDFGRVDLIVDRDSGPQLLEINTIPGFTPHSLLPKAAAHIGIRFDELVDRLVEMALRRSPVTEGCRD